MLFKPADALRVRWNTNSDTPMPPDEPNMPNPPEGASIDYYLKSAASGPVVLEVLTTDGKLVRRYSSADPVTQLPEPTASSLPLYWYRPPQGLSAAAGMHRFPWDVHYQPLGGGAGGGRAGGLPIAAVPYNTVNPPSTPWVNPGTYTVKLTVDGKSYTQPITVKQDPRVKTPALVMQTIYAETKAAYFGAIDAQDAARQAQGLRDQIAGHHAEADGGRRRLPCGVRQEGASADWRRGGRRRRWGSRRRGCRRRCRRARWRRRWRRAWRWRGGRGCGRWRDAAGRDATGRGAAGRDAVRGCADGHPQWCEQRAVRCDELAAGRGCGTDDQSDDGDRRREEDRRRGHDGLDDDQDRGPRGAERETESGRIGRVETAVARKPGGLKPAGYCGTA